MNLAETAGLCAAVQAISPATKMSDDTPVAWQVVLEDLPLPLVMDALKAVAKRSPFLDVATIRKEALSIRAKRVAAVELPLPNVDPGDPAAYMAEQRALLAAAADGTMTAERAARYARGGMTLTGAPPRLALDAPTTDRASALAALTSGVGGRP